MASVFFSCFVLFCSIAFRFTSGWEKLRYLFFRVELDSSNWLIHWPIPSSFSNGSFLSFSAYYNIVVCVCVVYCLFFLLFKREMPSRINRLIHPERHQFYVMVSRLFFYFLFKFFSSLSYPFMNIHEWNEFEPSSSSRKPIALYIFGFLIFDDYINRPCSSSSSFWPSHAAVCCVCAHSFIIFLTFNFQSFKPLFYLFVFFFAFVVCLQFLTSR